MDLRPLLADLPTFLAVVEHGSFTAAAASRGVGTPAVSMAVRRLEEAIGTPLLLRTTRSVALTGAGKRVWRAARDALGALERELGAVEAAIGSPRGEVRISLSPVLGRPLVAALPPLLSAHPALRPTLSFDDRPAHLVDHPIDLVLRIGALPDTSLLARRLGACRWALVASPSYLAEHGTPASAATLGAHRAARWRPPGGEPVPWYVLDERGQRVAVTGDTALVVDQGDLLIDAALAGIGVAQLFRYMVAPLIEHGELVELLPALAPPGLPLHALWLPERDADPRVRAVLDFLVARLPAAFWDGGVRELGRV